MIFSELKRFFSAFGHRRKRHLNRRLQWNQRTNAEVLEERQLLTTVEFRFEAPDGTKLYPGHFFDEGTDARATMDAVATEFSERLDDTLQAIAPDGTNTWSPRIGWDLRQSTPSTDAKPLGGWLIDSDLIVPADTLVVYVGMRDLTEVDARIDPRAVAIGNAGWAANVQGTAQWRTAVDNRGERPLGTEFDVGIWGGMLVFNQPNWLDDAAWHTDHNKEPDGWLLKKNDLYTAAMHEMGHVLGIGTDAAWLNLVDQENDVFTGQAAKAAYGGQDVPLHAEIVTDNAGNVIRKKWDHFAAGVHPGGPAASGAPAAMGPEAPVGERQPFTQLDWAALQDMGWNVTGVFAVPFSSGIVQLGELNGRNGFQLQGGARDAGTGFSVSDAGDVNGDGIGDMIVGAPLVEINGAVETGETYIVFGRERGFPDTINLGDLEIGEGFRLQGDAYSKSGYSVSGAGDVNNDGFDDLLIGAPFADPNGFADAGEAFVVFGESHGFSSVIKLGGLESGDGFRLLGTAAGDYFGASVSGVGDVNGDGIDDLLVGAPGANPHGEDDGGESYLVFGRLGGFPQSVSVNELPVTEGFRLRGGSSYPNSGLSVSGAGDINGDTIDDLLIGATDIAIDGQRGIGVCYIVFGDTRGFPNGIDLDDMTGVDGFRVQTGSVSAGWSVSGSGDVNNDGYDDLIIGPYSWGLLEYRASSVVFGRAGDFPSIMYTASLLPSEGFRLAGVRGNNFSFGHSVSAAGDVNSDGIDDIVVGNASAHGNGESYSGESFVVFGRDDSFPVTLSLSNLESNDGFRLPGKVAYDTSGSAVSGVGDVNGDGIDDLIISAPSADRNGELNIGESYVVFGQKSYSAPVVLPGTSRILSPVSDVIATAPTFEWTSVSHAATYELMIARADANRTLVFSRAGLTGTSLTVEGLTEPGVYRVEVRGWSSAGHAGPWSSARVYEVQAASQETAQPFDQFYTFTTPAYNGAGTDIALRLDGLKDGQSYTVSAAHWRNGSLKFAPLSSFTHQGNTSFEIVEVDLSDGDVALDSTFQVAVTNDKPIFLTLAEARYVDPATIEDVVLVTPEMSELPTIDLPDLGSVRFHRWDWTAMQYVSVASEDLHTINWNQDTRILTHGWDDGLGTQIDDEYMVRYAHSLKSLQPGDYSQINVIAIDWREGADPDKAETLRDAAVKTAVATLFGGITSGAFGTIRDGGTEFLSGAWDALHDARQSAQNGIQIGRSSASHLLNAWLQSRQVPSSLTLIGHSNGGGLMASMATELFFDPIIVAPNLSGTNASLRSTLDDLLEELGRPLPDTRLVALDTPTARLTAAGIALHDAATLLPDIKIANYYIQMGGFVGGRGADAVANYNLESTIQFWGDHGEIAGRFADSSDWMALGAHDHAFEIPGSGSYWQEVRADGWVTRTQNDAIASVNDAARQYSTAALDGIAQGAGTFWDFVKAAASTTRDAIVNSTRSVNSRLLFPAGTLLDSVPQILGQAHSPVDTAIEVAIPDEAQFLSFSLSVFNPGNNDVLYVMAGNQILGSFDLTTLARFGPTTQTVFLKDLTGTTQTIHFYMPSDDPSDAEFVIADLEFLSLQTGGNALTADIIDVTPDPHAGPVGEVIIEYSEDVATLEIFEFQLTRDGVAVNIESLTLNGSGARYSIDLSSVTATPGNYELRLVAADSDAVNAVGIGLTEDLVETWTVTASGNGGLQNYGASGEFFFDPSTGLYWYDPAEWLGETRNDIDAFVQNSQWEWASFQQIDALKGKTSADDQLLTKVMGPQTLTLTQGGYRWMGFYDGQGSGAGLKPDGWLVQTNNNSFAKTITATGFKNGAATQNPGAWLVTTTDPATTMFALTKPISETNDATPKFQWNAAAGAVNYELWVNNADAKTRAIYETGLTSLTFTPRTALVAGRYDAWVRPTLVNGQRGDWSPRHRFVVDVTDVAPGLPVILSPGNTTTTAVRPEFSWTTTPGATRYELWVTHVPSGTRMLHETALTNTSFTPSIDLQDGKHRVWVRAFGADGQSSDWTAATTFTVGAASIPVKPTINGPDATTSDTTPTFLWTTDSNASRTELWVNNVTTGSGRVIHEQNLTGGTFTASTLAAGKYRVWLRSFNAAGDTAGWMVAYDFTITGVGQKLPATTIIAPHSDIAFSRPTIQWEAITDAVRYELWVNNVDTGARYLHKTDIDGTGYASTIDFLPARYRAWVRGIDVAGPPGEWSPAFNFAVLSNSEPPAPPVVVGPLENTSNRRPRFDWQSVNGATGYELWVSSRDENRAVIYARNLTATSFDTPEPLVPGRYRFWLRSVGPGGQKSDWTAAVDFNIVEVRLPGEGLWQPEDSTVMDSVVHDLLLVTSSASGNTSRRNYAEKFVADDSGESARSQVPQTKSTDPVVYDLLMEDHAVLAEILDRNTA